MHRILVVRLLCRSSVSRVVHCSCPSSRRLKLWRMGAVRCWSCEVEDCAWDVVSECWDEMRIVVRRKWECVQWVRANRWPRAGQELLKAHSAKIYSWWHDVYLCYGVVKLSVGSSRYGQMHRQGPSAGQMITRGNHPMQGCEAR